MSFVKTIKKIWKVIETGWIIDTKYFHLELAPFNFNDLEYNFYINIFGVNIGVDLGFKELFKTEKYKKHQRVYIRKR